MRKSLHFWRIHAKVCKRLWTDISLRQREIIAADPTGPEAVWFETKVMSDATRLYEDPSYYENQEFSFRYPKHEAVELLQAA